MKDSTILLALLIGVIAWEATQAVRITAKFPKEIKEQPITKIHVKRI